MAKQFSLAAELQPVTMLAPAADAAGRTSSYYSLKNALKAFILVTLNQGNAATIALTPLQATNVAGASSKVLSNNIPISLVADSSAASAYVAQAAAKNYTTDATIKTKKVLFELDLNAALDVQNGFDCIAIQTGASNAANITAADLFIMASYQGATPPDPLVN